MDIWQQILTTERKLPTPAEMREALGTPDGNVSPIARNSLAWTFGYAHDAAGPMCGEFVRLFVRRFYMPGQLVSVSFRDNVGIAFDLVEPPTPAWVKPGVTVCGGRVVDVGPTPNRLQCPLGRHPVVLHVGDGRQAQGPKVAAPERNRRRRTEPRRLHDPADLRHPPRRVIHSRQDALL